MTASDAASEPRLDVPGRVVSVDVLRGLTILLMVFVNDLGPAAPSWLLHVRPPDADAMTVADVVFPWFLFIVGVSIPLAFERAFARGASLRREIGHVLARTAGLLAMGVIANNAPADRTLGGEWWEVLGLTALLFAWSVPPERPGTRRTVFRALKAAGVVGLLALLAVYRREAVDATIPLVGTVEGWRWLRTGWWGILGLIGWAYLTAALLTLWLGRRREWLAGATGILISFHMAMSRGLFARVDSKPWLDPLRPLLDGIESIVDTLDSYIDLGGATGSLAAVVTAGCLLGSILRRDSDAATPRDRVGWALTFAMGLFVAGLATDPFEGVNKIAATPTWCLWSAALAVLLWLVLYLIIDVKGWRAWTIAVGPTGANPLIAYFLHPIVVTGLSLAGLWGTVLGYKDSESPGVAVAGSLAMVFCVRVLTGLLARAGLRVRL